ncbi:MAG TPA: vanadium-dependent haloperoxidase [Phycisphaerales bacterium]|nr:vanadium-dependent haloperoxidase [Phycisphaerales bacterium]
MPGPRGGWWVAFLVGIATLLAPGLAQPALAQTHSVAREWNELLLASIRRDFARPTVHARNLYHTSAAMYDAWATYDSVADQVIHHEKLTAADPLAARNEAISFAMYRLLRHRFASSPGASFMFPLYDAKMAELGYDVSFTSTVGTSPAAVGNRIAATVIAFGLADGANEAGNYANQQYFPVNPPLLMTMPGNPNLVQPNRWQPLALSFFIDQNGQVVPTGYPPALTPEWGNVTPFALRPDQSVVNFRDGNPWRVYLDPGAPPLYGTATDNLWKWNYELCITWSGHLDPSDGVMWDISPGAMGNAQLPTSAMDLAQMQTFYDTLEGNDNGQGYPVNPVTGQPYAPQIVPRGDYARALAEFWADGPSSETPPGHWFSILNYVNDHPLFVKRFGGTGPILDDLQWDVKAYLALGGAVHDAAVAAWGLKGWYDYVRPVSAIRYMCSLGQCSDPAQPSFNPAGVHLIPGRIEVITNATIQPGERHEHLAGQNNANVGKIAIYAWRGPTVITDPVNQTAGAGWILADSWWPYQRPTFVSPPFPGYVSGHSTFSRSGALAMTMLTGSEYFPGGLGEFVCPQNQYLVFEDGPSTEVRLQWARYMDASDQCSLSRIWGGIHPPADDIPGRQMGQIIGPQAFRHARAHFRGRISCPADFNNNNAVNTSDISSFLSAWFTDLSTGTDEADFNASGATNTSDVTAFLSAWFAALAGGC